MRIVPLLALVAVGLTACSSSGKTVSIGNDQIGKPHPASTSKPAVPAVALGAPATKDALKLTISGPVTAKKDGDNGPGLIVTFQVSMTNTGDSGVVDGPWAYGIRCDANRTGDLGGWWASSTAANKKIPTGQTITGTADVDWLEWNSFTKCTGPTEIDASWPGRGFMAWMLPDDVVAKVNAVGGA